jgi:hypothetical protein
LSANQFLQSIQNDDLIDSLTVRNCQSIVSKLNLAITPDKTNILMSSVMEDKLDIIAEVKKYAALVAPLQSVRVSFIGNILYHSP